MSIRFAIRAIALLGLSLVSGNIWAQAQLSEGCVAVNAVQPDYAYSFDSTGTKQFYAGERITVTAGPPTNTAIPTEVGLYVDNVMVDSAVFPGTATHLIPSDQVVDVAWWIDDGNATWVVECVFEGTSTASYTEVPMLSGIGLIFMAMMLLLIGRVALSIKR